MPSKTKPKGGNKIAETKINYKSKTQVDTNMKINRIVSEAEADTDRKYYCFCCGKGYTQRKGNFYRSNSILYYENSGYVQICKTCCEKYYDQLIDFFCGNEEKAMDRICQLFDFYYSPEASAAASKSVAGTPKVSLYSSKMNLNHVKNKGSDYLQTIRDRLEEGDKILEVSALQPQVIATKENDPDGGAENEETFVITKAIIKNWGTGYTPDEYEFLEDQYNDWITKNECNTKSQEEIYKNIALAQLNIRRAIRYGGKITEAQKALQDLMNSAAILPKQTAENSASDSALIMGVLAEKYEKTKPIPEPAPEWRDPDGIRKYVNTWFLGGLSKALHIKNANAELYDESVKEMNRYTVQREALGISADGLGDQLFSQEDNNTVDIDMLDSSPHKGGDANEREK